MPTRSARALRFTARRNLLAATANRNAHRAALTAAGRAEKSDHGKDGRWAPGRGGGGGGAGKPKQVKAGVTQLTGSFAPKSAKPETKPTPPAKEPTTKLAGSFAPKGQRPEDKKSSGQPSPGVTQLKGSFAPKGARPEDTPPAPKAPPKAKPAVPKPGGRTFRNNTVGRDWASENLSVAALTPDQKKAVANYTGAGYGPINRGLRASKGTKVSQKAAAMDAAIEAAPRIPEPIGVTRLASLQALGIRKGGKVDPSALVGKKFVDHGYMSTSMNRAGVNVDGDANVKLHLTVPKGHKALYVSGDRNGAGALSSVGKTEAELILGRGSGFRVTGMKRDGGTWVVHAEVE